MTRPTNHTRSKRTPRPACAPQHTDWYAHAIIGRDVPGGTETSEIDGYYAGRRPTRAVFGPLPAGWYLVEFASERIGR